MPSEKGLRGPPYWKGKSSSFTGIGNEEIVESLAADTGIRQWATKFPATYGGGINADRGPRCVPVATQKYVVVYGAAGDLHCLDRKTGKKVWSRNTWRDFAAPEGYFGAGSTPVISDDNVLVNVGGKNGALAAFALSDGKTRWAGFRDTASYSSPALAQFGDKTVAVFLTRLNCVAVEPASGNVVFEFPFGKRGPTVNAATPLVDKNQLFVTAAYGIGGKMARIDGARILDVWANDESLSSQYSTPVLADGYLYGTHGREDFRNGELRCVAAATGKVMWTDRSTGVAHIIAAGSRALVLSVEGNLRLIELNSSALKTLAESRVSTGTTRALPALADGRLFVRTSGGNGRIEALVVGKQAAR